MKELFVPFIEDKHSFEELNAFLEFSQTHKINQISWQGYPYLPNVTFKIAYTRQAILLEYEVSEQDLRVVYKEINDPVYKDSCVEFFISFDETHYYNFEFNSIGTALVGYGTSDRKKRQRLPVSLIEKIKTVSIIEDREIEEEQHWRLQLQIPFELFYKEHFESLKGMTAKANFYKCGDDLLEPHFVSWNKIGTEKPNFHSPQYFGEIKFI